MEENRADIIAERIKGWVKAQRIGEQAEKPCFWSIYELSSISSKLARNHPTNSDNLVKGDLEESVEHLLECMSFSTHVRYFAVRLRAKEKDTGVLNNFENPYYETPYKNPRSQIGNIPQVNQGGTTQMIIGLIQSMNEDRAAQREETNAILTELRLQNKEQEYKFKEYKNKQEIKRLEDQISSISGGNDNFWKDVVGQLMPEIKQGVSRLISGESTEYLEDDVEDDLREGDGEQAIDNDNREILNRSLNMLSTKVNNPETLVFKMAVVLCNSTEEEYNNLLGAVQVRYDQIKNNKANEQ